MISRQQNAWSLKDGGERFRQETRRSLRAARQGEDDLSAGEE